MKLELDEKVAIGVFLFIVLSILVATHYLPGGVLGQNSNIGTLLGHSIQKVPALGHYCKVNP